MEHLNSHKTEHDASKSLRTRLIPLFLLFLMALVNFGCEDCDRFDCAYSVAILDLNILQDGQDIVFGSSPLITPEEISVQSEQDFNASLRILENSVVLTINNSDRVTIEISNLETLILQVETRDTSSNSCCPLYEISKIESEGETVCASDCTELDIEVN